jgi:glycosyltransferase involved in cell wall biosynthesis
MGDAQMEPNARPLVSVVTPVYNGEPYLVECIESVLAQTYPNWEYIIVNNCSKDRTLEIAKAYANKDSRIRVHDNQEFVGVIANHNIAFSLISPQSKYCKVVSADDWLLPNCLTLMVNLAETNPGVGIVGSYQLSGGGSNWRNWRVRWAELPYPSPVISGRELSRMQMLGGPYVFGTPTSTLYRSDLVRKRNGFYPNALPEADTSACYKCLQETDFGFVHQVLSYERVHENTISKTAKELNAYLPSKINDLLAYGSSCMTSSELENRLEQLLEDYYRMLAVGAVNLREKQFWTYHRGRLKEFGHPLSRLKLCKTIFLKVLDLVLNPKQTAEILWNRAKGHHA